MAYLDNAGLYRKYGTEKAVADNAGDYRTNGAFRELELRIDLTSLTQAEVTQSDVVFLPKARIAEVKVVTHTVAATGVAIDLGTVSTVDRTTEIDFDGLLAAFPLASMDTAGETTTLTKGSTFAGAIIGTTPTLVGYITCSATTSAVFTTGVIFVTIKYYQG